MKQQADRLDPSVSSPPASVLDRKGELDSDWQGCATAGSTVPFRLGIPCYFPDLTASEKLEWLL